MSQVAGSRFAGSRVRGGFLESAGKKRRNRLTRTHFTQLH